MPERSKAENAFYEASLGAFSAAGACLVSNPIDVIRVKLQLAATQPREGVLGMARILHQESGLRAGLPPALLYNIVLNATRFAVFDSLTSSGIPAGLSGFSAGFLAGTIASPFARARTLMQARSDTGWADLTSRPFSGATTWGLRNAGHTACIFAGYGYLKDAVELRRPETPAWQVHLGTSLVAASFSCCVMNPIDLLCTRVYDASAARSPATPLQILQDAVAADGFAGLYRGLTANLARIVPHTVVTFVIAETVRTRVGLRRLAPSGNLTYGDTAEKETMETLCHQMRMDTSPRPERVHATEVPSTGWRKKFSSAHDELRILRDELRAMTQDTYSLQVETENGAR
jgi:hypothetical protein